MTRHAAELVLYQELRDPTTSMAISLRYVSFKGVSHFCLLFLSWSQGYHKGKAFIATQGPLPDTADDFWRLVWEQKSASIVVLAREREGGKVSHGMATDLVQSLKGFGLCRQCVIATGLMPSHKCMGLLRSVSIPCESTLNTP